LRKVPDVKIVAAKLKMQKFKTENKLLAKPNHQELIAKLEEEYHQLIERIKLYGQVQKEYLIAEKTENVRRCIYRN